MHFFNPKTFIAFIVLVAVLLVTAGAVSAQEVPSHTELTPTSNGGFDSPTQLKLFQTLLTEQNAIVANITQANFSSAVVHMAKYNRTADVLSASVNDASQDPTISAIQGSRNDLSQLIQDGKRYNALYINETTLLTTMPRSNASIANALEMKSLNDNLNGVATTIDGRQDDIYGVALQNRLDLSRQQNVTTLLDTYTKQLDSRLANVTATVFQTPTLTLTAGKNSTTYGDKIVLRGALRADQTGLPNSSVELSLDNTTTIATVSTKANGSYEYAWRILDVPRGVHTVVAQYTPTDAPYNPAQSSAAKVSVASALVHNRLTALSKSLALGSDLQAQGRLTTANVPVTNGTVALYVGDTRVAQTSTDENGTYSFSAPVNQFYLPSLLSGATVHTVFEPVNQPLEGATSTTTSILVDPSAVYGASGGIAVLAVAGAFLYTRSLARKTSVTPTLTPKKPAPITSEATEAAETPEVAETTEAAALAPQIEPTTANDELTTISRARDLFRNGDEKGAIGTLYDTALDLVAHASGAVLLEHMTEWEKYSAVTALLPEVSDALRTLTNTHEQVFYGSRPLTETAFDTCITAFKALPALINTKGG